MQRIHDKPKGIEWSCAAWKQDCIWW